ncbi:MAG: electron transport complex subunit RsxE [Clostridiales bacterium]|jgi:Na+-transporting NADH:ubiquinone oxidoreductase subunit D|nr:electron transport complex subunit RsxE [Clostridiales bacterium]
MAAEKIGANFKRNMFTENQVLRAILGICSSLAVTNTMRNSLVMGLGVAFVTGLSSLTLSLMRNIIPFRVRMLVQTLVIAAYVIFVDLFLQAFLPDISKQLGPYVGLIITNCIIMGRAEAYAQSNPPIPAMFDGFFAGLGYTMVLLFISLIREVLGFGTIFGMNVNFIGFETWTIMIMPPAAFFIIGSMIWFISARAAKKEAPKAK